MARKNGSRSSGPESSGSIHFDTATKTVMAETSQENVKEKVQSVREVVPGKSNNEVVLVLQYYDYNVERAIQAYLEDGAKVALQEWTFTGTKQPNKKRKNKKKGSADKSGDKVEESAISTVTDGKSEPVVNGKEEILQNGVMPHGPEPSPLDSPTSQASVETAQHQDQVLAGTYVKDIANIPSKDSTQTATASSSPLPQRQTHPKGKGHNDSHRSHHHHHDNTRQRTASEKSTGSGVGDGHHKRPFHGLEKAFKDLQRQTTSLERLRHLLDHEIDRSYKSVKSVFEELRKGLNERESKVMVEMDLLKKEASEMLEMRQNKASDLKRQLERSESLKEAEVSDLRADIKHFVTERRHDEELGRTTRFLYDSDHLIGEISKFGEVVHVKSMYTTRRLSTSSVASSSVSHDDNQEEDLSQSQEMSELQDRLRLTLKLQNSTADHLSSTRNGASDDFIPSRSFHNSQLNGHDTGRRTDTNKNRSPRYRQKMNSDLQDSTYSKSVSAAPSHNEGSFNTTGSPGRGGRGRGRGRGRGGGRGRGHGDGRPYTPRREGGMTSTSANSNSQQQRPTSGDSKSSKTQQENRHQARVVVSAISD